MFDEQEKQEKYFVKGVMVGWGKSGKTSILSRMCHDYFAGLYTHTVGIDMTSKVISSNNRVINVQFWDSDTDSLKAHHKLLLNGSMCMMMVYSITDAESFTFLQESLQKLREVEEIPVKVLIGNKSDLEDERKVDRAKGEQLANKYQMHFLEASAKDCTNMAQLLQHLTFAITQRVKA